MSRKTRRQKILAAVHRKSQAEITAGPSDLTSYHYQAPAPGGNASPMEIPALQEATNEKNFILQGLARTAVFTVLAIGAQIVLWYLLERHVVKLF